MRKAGDRLMLSLVLLNGRDAPLSKFAKNNGDPAAFCVLAAKMP